MAHTRATYTDASPTQFTGHYDAGTLGICFARPVCAPATGSDVATTYSKCGQSIRYRVEAFLHLGDEGVARAPAILCRCCGGGDQ